MEHEWTFESAESHQQFNNAVSGQVGHVVLEGKGRRRRSSVVADDLVRFEMNVDGVPPATAAVAADPAFDGSQSGGRIGQMRVVELLVDLPCAVTAMEVERANAHGGCRIQLFVRTQ